MDFSITINLEPNCIMALLAATGIWAITKAFTAWLGDR